MHKNSSPFINKDTDSNKENIPPPTLFITMPADTRQQERRNAPRVPLQELSMSPDPNDLVITQVTSPEPLPSAPTSPETSTALTKQTGNCPKCRLPYHYDHVAWCRGLSDGYTCRCHKKPPASEPTSPTIVETEPDPIHLFHTSVQQLDEFYPDKASYLTFRTKVINEPTFTAFDYAYHSHRSVKAQIEAAEDLLKSLRIMDESHITAVEAALIEMRKGPLNDTVFSKTTTEKDEFFTKMTTTYIHQTPSSITKKQPYKRRSTYPKRQVSILIPQGTGSSSGSQSNPINVETYQPPPRPRKKHFPRNTCFKCGSTQHYFTHCSLYKCWRCNRIAPGHHQIDCLQRTMHETPHVLEDNDYYDDFISADADYNLSGE